MKKFWFDIFEDGRFKQSVFLLFPKNWVFTESDIVDGILTKYPSLKGTKWSLKCS